MSETEYTENGELYPIMIEGLTEKEAAEYKQILGRFLESYKKSDGEQQEFQWLKEQLREELPEKTDQEIEEIKTEIVTSIQEYDNNLKDLNENLDKGKTKESWFAETVMNGSSIAATAEYGQYLQLVSETIENANELMIDTVMTNKYEFSQCKNLDGFIAEQYHVNMFNMKAAIEKSNIRARVLKPLPGEKYGKNSVDIVLENIKTGKRVHQYQSKFGKDAKSTIALLKQGDYNNQRFIVPTEQVSEVSKAFPNKTVTDHLGGTDKVKITSKPLTKQEVKQHQKQVQKKGSEPQVGYGNLNNKYLAKELGGNAAKSGGKALLVCAEVELAAKTLNGEQIEGDELVENALKTGMDAGVKAAASGALTVAVETEKIPYPKKGTSANTIVMIVCAGIENIKIMTKVAKGELTVSEGMEEMGSTTVAMYAGLKGAVLFSAIPVVGPVIGGLVGGMIGYAAGSKVGRAVVKGARKIGNKVKEGCYKAKEKVKEVGNKIKDFIFG